MSELCLMIRRIQRTNGCNIPCVFGVLPEPNSVQLKCCCSDIYKTQQLPDLKVEVEIQISAHTERTLERARYHSVALPFSSRELVHHHPINPNRIIMRLESCKENRS